MGYISDDTTPATNGRECSTCCRILTTGLVILNQHDADLTVCDDMFFSPQKGFRVYIQVGEI